MVNRFCPKCGKKVSHLVRNFCKDCFLEDHQDLVVVEKEILVDFCSRCDKIKLREKWVQIDTSELVDYVKRKVKVTDLNNAKVAVTVKELETNKMIANIVVLGEIDNHILQIEKAIIVKLKPGICDACMKLSSNYHEAIIQVRGNKDSTPSDYETALKDIDYELSILRTRNSLAKVIQVTKVRKGYDLMVGSKRAAKIAAEKVGKQYNWKLVQSSKLIGITRDGTQNFRDTYLLRIAQAS